MSFVTKRSGQKEPIQFDKITERISKLICPSFLQDMKLSYSDFVKEKEFLDPILVAQKVVANLYSGITTEELDIESADICINLSTTHPLYSYLGGRILVSNLHKKTSNKFSEKMILINQLNPELIDPKWLAWVIEFAPQLDTIIDYNRDYMYDYFGFKTLEKSYLIKAGGKIIERPQDMLLRVAITLQLGNLPMIKQTYDSMSLGFYTHATPTLFNSGTTHMQLSSCFLLGTEDDLTAIGKTWQACAQISKWSGGIGLHVSNIRAQGSLIKKTNGISNGLVPFLKVFNEIARYIDQGGKRPGSIAIYLEPHHPDIFEFLSLRKNFGSETERARDLFLALWISDLFMKQVESDGDWYLLSEDDCPGLTDVYGDAYEKLYWSYVNANKSRGNVKARKLWSLILESQIETGLPYISYKDAVNKKSNQKNIGTIKSSNLCNEINQYSDSKEFAVCNLASISLKAFVTEWTPEPTNQWIVYTKPNCKYCSYAKSYLTSMDQPIIEHEYTDQSVNFLKGKLSSDKITFPQIWLKSIDSDEPRYIGGWSDLYKFTRGSFSYEKLYEQAYLATINLNQVIDINYYPVPEAKLSNLKHRPVGLGIQGLADALVLMRIPYDSDDALEFNRRFMETIYLASVEASNFMARDRAGHMKQLITKLETISLELIPKFYCSEMVFDNFGFDSSDLAIIEQLYHKLKPTRDELSRDKELTTIGSYSTFEGSPFSQGLFQFDLWGVEPLFKEKWDRLRPLVIKWGTRNSLLTALMPTASTSQILSNNECFEFFTNNIYTRKTHAGDFILVNKYLVNDLIKIGLWSPDLKNSIIGANGSIQTIDSIPPEMKALYKTIWEIKQIWVLEGAAKRGPYVDQTQSMNVFMAEPDDHRLANSHFWAWRNGLKTGMYYLRTKPATNATKFTVDPKHDQTTEMVKPPIEMVKHSIKTTYLVTDCDNCSA
jgi:ribonucleoside-diphosphate reductase alpha subunit